MSHVEFFCVVLWLDTNISEAHAVSSFRVNVHDAFTFKVKLVYYNNTTRHNPEELYLNLHRLKNLKSHKNLCCFCFY